MQLVSLVSILLASAGSALGSPAPIVETRSLETVLYKRGDVLDKRGYELAALHGVDTNEMYRHSLVRRSDGDDITVWVHNSFNETIADDTDSSPILEDRGVRLLDKAPLRQGNWWNQYSDACGSSSYHSLTSRSLGAYTGGVTIMRRWGNTNLGGFHIEGYPNGRGNHVGLLIAGSNGGANACFMAVMEGSRSETVVGTRNIAKLADETLRFRKRYDNGDGERTAAWGEMTCPANNAGTTRVNWRITYINKRA